MICSAQPSSIPGFVKVTMYNSHAHLCLTYVLLSAILNRWSQCFIWPLVLLVSSVDLRALSSTPKYTSLFSRLSELSTPAHTIITFSWLLVLYCHIDVAIWFVLSVLSLIALLSCSTRKLQHRWTFLEEERNTSTRNIMDSQNIILCFDVLKVNSR